ncbi:hypothetical protein PV326_006600 [Microctonus aethiopoides]|nr:hypothetical protein PV326_006600 [Microctonus aethiopoides]
MGVYGSQDSILDLTNERDPWLFNPSTRAPSGVLEDAVAVIESTVSRAVEAESSNINGVINSERDERSERCHEHKAFIFCYHLAVPMVPSPSPSPN